MSLYYLQIMSFKYNFSNKILASSNRHRYTFHKHQSNQCKHLHELLGLQNRTASMHAVVFFKLLTPRMLGNIFLLFLHTYSCTQFVFCFLFHVIGTLCRKISSRFQKISFNKVLLHKKWSNTDSFYWSPM